MSRVNGFVFRPVSAAQMESAQRTRMKLPVRCVTLVRSTRTRETYLWDIEAKCEVDPEELPRKR